MSFKPLIKEVLTTDRNDEGGLHQFVVTLSNQTKCRLFFSKNPDWKIIGVNRLLNIPCPICRKDYYCNCMSKYAEAFEQQIFEKNLIQ